jgi:hypothetical protein
LLVTLLAATPALAARKKAKPAPKKPDEATLQEVSIPMARGELQAEIDAEMDQRARANAPRTQLELGASTWKPARAVTGSCIANATEFDTKGIPAIDVSLFSPLAGRQLKLQFGVGFLAVQRTGSIESSGLSVPLDQNGYITTVRLGAAYSPRAFWGDRLTPYVSAAALPSMLVTRPSAFDDGVNDTGVPFELGAGTLIRVSHPVNLDLGVSQVLGTVQDSDFKGFAVRAGVRMPI